MWSCPGSVVFVSVSSINLPLSPANTSFVGGLDTLNILSCNGILWWFSGLWKSIEGAAAFYPFFFLPFFGLFYLFLAHAPPSGFFIKTIVPGSHLGIHHSSSSPPFFFFLPFFFLPPPPGPAMIYLNTRSRKGIGSSGISFFSQSVNTRLNFISGTHGGNTPRPYFDSYSWLDKDVYIHFNLS